MEIRKIIRTYSVDKSCEKCKKGFMRPTGNYIVDNLAGKAVSYYHKCNQCDYLNEYEKQYPCIEYGE